MRKKIGKEGRQHRLIKNFDSKRLVNPPDHSSDFNFFTTFIFFAGSLSDDDEEKIIYVQRRFLNKHLHHFVHVSLVSFIPPLVSKSYLQCIRHT